jgi:hypothetical protein
VKNSPQKAAEIELAILALHESIERVTANPATGSVLILYDARLTKQPHIFQVLRNSGYSGNALAAKSKLTPRKLGKDLYQSVLSSTMEFALERLIFALV